MFFAAYQKNTHYSSKISHSAEFWYRTIRCLVELWEDAGRFSIGHASPRTKKAPSAKPMALVCAS